MKNKLETLLPTAPSIIMVNDWVGSIDDRAASSSVVDRCHQWRQASSHPPHATDPMIGTGSLQAAGGRTGACTSDLDLTRFSSLDRIHALAGERDPSIHGRVQQLDQALRCYNYSSIVPVPVAVASSCNCIAGPDGKYNNVAADDRYIPRTNFLFKIVHRSNLTDLSTSMLQCVLAATTKSQRPNHPPARGWIFICSGRHRYNVITVDRRRRCPTPFLTWYLIVRWSAS